MKSAKMVAISEVNYIVPCLTPQHGSLVVKIGKLGIGTFLKSHFIILSQKVRIGLLG
jgi:hypothetical protein